MRLVRMKLSFWVLLGWVLPVGVLVGGVGVPLTWWLVGREGLVAEALAAVIVLPIMVASAAIVVGVASFGPALITAVFVSIGVMRLTAVMATALIVYRFCRIPTLAFWIWVVVFYLAMFAAEVAWLARALKRDASDVAIGRIDRSPLW
jgi:hypothetical protein